MHLHEQRRYYHYEGPTVDDGLGNLWTKLRDKVIKPVGRVVAAYYTGGASELAFQAYDKANAQKKAAAQQKAYLASMGVGQQAVPGAYPAFGTPGAQAYVAGGGIMPAQPRQQLPEWVLPAAAGIGALFIVKSMGKKR